MSTDYRATVRNGQIELVDEVDLPEGALLSVTILDEDPRSLGEQIIAGLKDIRDGRFTVVTIPEEFQKHMDKLFSD